MVNAFKGILFGTVLGFFAFVLLDYAGTIPDVHISYATNECVQVLNYPTVFFGTTEYSCETLPSKYHHVWVK